jgi:hypothetical protein
LSNGWQSQVEYQTLPQERYRQRARTMYSLSRRLSTRLLRFLNIENMIRYFLFLFLLLPIFLIGQTIEAEKAFLNQMVKNEKMDIHKSRELTIAWSGLLDQFGGYPDLPINEKTKKVEFVKVKTFEGKGQIEIYKMIKEWIAINYGSMDEVIHYEDPASGKIIVKGHFIMEVENKYKTFWGNERSLSSSWVTYHTAIFTVKKEKLKIEFSNIRYEYETGGYELAGYYIPLETRNFPISDLYPVTKTKNDSWEYRLSILQKTSLKIQLTMSLIEDYVKESEERNGF